MSNNQPTILITGGAKRIGKAIAEHFHANGFNVVISYRHSQSGADSLVSDLNQLRSNSAKALPLDLSDYNQFKAFSLDAINAFGGIDVLVNNASAFYPTPIENASNDDWDDLMGSNVKAAFFLSQALLPELKKQQGSIINLVDIYAEKPLKDHPIYSMSKAAIAMMTRALAQDLAPDVRVNGISPGAILWPETSNPEWEKALLEKVPMQRIGSAEDIARTAYFLSCSAPYITGQIIAVDGGRSLNM